MAGLGRGAWRGLWTSLGRLTWARAVVAKHRTAVSLRAATVGFADRRAEARARFLHTLLAMIVVGWREANCSGISRGGSIEGVVGGLDFGLTSSLGAWSLEVRAHSRQYHVILRARYFHRDVFFRNMICFDANLHAAADFRK